MELEQKKLATLNRYVRLGCPQGKNFTVTVFSVSLSF